MRHYASRGLLAVLSAFIAITTIAGAVFVVPDLPREWIAGSVFTDYTIPALALGFVGGLAVVSLVFVIVQPEYAGLLAAITGAAMVAFELVEIWAVGFSLIEYGIDEPFAWLQVVYIAAGTLTAAAGVELWQATRVDRERLARTGATSGLVHH
jgi:hypothetical protein